MHLCENEIQILIKTYEARLGGLKGYLHELDSQGKSETVNYKINDKLSTLLNLTIKDLNAIAEKIKDENRYKIGPTRYPEK